jgi:preprotein translocase subunit SecD
VSSQRRQRERLIVELPGVANVEDAVREIGKTPLLEFKLVDADCYEAIQAAEAHHRLRSQDSNRISIQALRDGTSHDQSLSLETEAVVDFRMNRL